jgi:DNA (cytosine-5)-methyltransferase 1
MVHAGMAVRRLTPRECERLQGFPDDYTAIAWRKKSAADCPDGPRYKALGNSWAVPVVRWIGQRIADATNLQSPPTVGATA